MSDTKIKENSLNEEMAQTAIMFLRIVTSKLTGDSKLIQIQNLILQISNVYGLQTALDSKIGVVTGEPLEIPIFKTDGTLQTSGLRATTFTTQLELDACTQSGFYTHIGTDLVMDMVGSVLFAQVGNAYRLLFGTNGLWLQTYTTGWSLPRYVGGAFDNITIPYADAVDLATNGQLSPGASYKITGVGQDEGIILRAASADTFETDGIRLGLVPAHFDIGTFDLIVWKGPWRSTGTYAEDDHVVRYGRVFRNLTGNVGTEDGFGLDATNWLLIDPLIGVNEGFYVREVFGCTYRLVSNLPLVFTTGYVSRQWDSKGNSFGIEVEPADGFKVEYNDFGNEFIYGNVLKSCRNNIALDANSSIYTNTGNGDIYDVSGTKVFLNKLTNYDNNIRNVACTGGEISNNVLTNDADIQYVQGASIVKFNTIEADLKGDSLAYCTFDVQKSTIGKAGLVKDNSIVTITNSQIHGVVDDNTNVELLDSILDPQSTIFQNTKVKLSRTRMLFGSAFYYCDHATFKHEYSVVGTQIYTETLTADAYRRDDITPFKPTTGETLKLSTPVYKDVNTAISSGRTGAANQPTWSAFSTNLGAYTFAIDDYIDLSTIEYPHECVVGGAVECHLHFATNGTDTTNRYLKFRLFYSYGLPDSGLYQFTAESYFDAEVEILANTPSKSLYKLHMGDIVDANMKQGAQIKFRIKRIAASSTAPTANPYLGQVGTHCLVDTLGSRSISTK